VSLLSRVARPAPADGPAPGEVAVAAAEAAAPGIAALLEDVAEDGSHAVLDLGSASLSSFRFYGRYARRIRFADVLGDRDWPRAHDSTDALLGTIPPQPDQPYDLVFAWDILDRLFVEDRPRLVERLAGVVAPHARLHVVVRGADEAADGALHYAIPAADRVRFEPLHAAPLPGPRILPADVMKLLDPFRVVHAFTLKSGRREYVAVR
jgi:hypothetical protein